MQDNKLLPSSLKCTDFSIQTKSPWTNEWFEWMNQRLFRDHLSILQFGLWFCSLSAILGAKPEAVALRLYLVAPILAASQWAENYGHVLAQINTQNLAILPIKPDKRVHCYLLACLLVFISYWFKRKDIYFGKNKRIFIEARSQWSPQTTFCYHAQMDLITLNGFRWASWTELMFIRMSQQTNKQHYLQWTDIMLLLSLASISKSTLSWPANQKPIN